MFLACGLALLGIVLLKTDLGDLWRQIAAVGLGGMAAVMLVYACYFGAEVVSWHFALPAVPFTPRWMSRMFVVRMIGEAYNNITPTASLGGEPIKAWLLKVNWGIPLRDSGASLVIAKTATVFTLVPFVAVGVFMLLQHPQFSATHKVIAVAGLGVILLFAVVFFLMQRLRLSTFVARRLGDTRFGQRLASVIAAAEDIDSQFAEFYGKRRARLAWSVVFAMANWILGVVEVWLILQLIGAPASFGEVWMIECMVQLVRMVTFFIPAGIGTQEGAFLVGFGALTGVPSVGVATALIRRARDLIWIGASLGLASLYEVTPGGVARGEYRA